MYNGGVDLPPLVILLLLHLPLPVLSVRAGGVSPSPLHSLRQRRRKLSVHLLHLCHRHPVRSVKGFLVFVVVISTAFCTWHTDRIIFTQFASLIGFMLTTELLRFKPIYWLSNPHRISYKLCLLTFRCLHSLAPKYLSSSIKPVSVPPLRASLWSFTSGQLLIPLVRKKRFGNCSFGYSAPAAWNSLPKELNDSSISLLSFKSMLKTLLFRS